MTDVSTASEMTATEVLEFFGLDSNEPVVDVSALIARVDVHPRIDEYAGVYDLVDALTEAGASTELRRISAGLDGFLNSPASWTVEFKTNQADVLPGSYPAAVRLYQELSAASKRVWSDRWCDVYAAFAIRRTGGGNFVLNDDASGGGKSGVNVILIRTGKSEDEVHTYLLRFAGDDEYVGESYSPEQVLADIIIKMMVDRYALQLLLKSSDWGAM